MSNLEDSGMWLSFYFSYGNDITIEALCQAIKNVLDQLENGFKKISQQRLAILKKNQKLEIAAKRLKTVKFILLGFILCACLLYVLLFFFLK